jgi:hypothetical protein
MNYNHLLDSLDTSDDKNRITLISFLKEEVKKLQDQPDLAIEIAYSIAGLMATDFARKLPEDDPIDEILTIAGELEIKPDNYEALRNELVNKVNALQ